MSTPAEHIDTIKALAQQIENEAFIRRCYVDDWGRDSNFQLVVYVKDDVFEHTNKGLLTRKIKKEFNQVLKDSGAHLREVFSPTAQYRRVGCQRFGKKVLEGYDRRYWVVDVDFQQYHSESNTFSS